MKTKVFLLITVLAVCFISCDREPEPPKENINYLESLIVMQSFLTNNHPKGDTIVFYNETSNLLDTFSVSYSEDLMVTIPKDTNNTDNEELGYIVYDTINVQSHVVLSNEEYFIEVSLNQSNTGLLYGGLLIYKDNERNTSIRGCEIENLSELANDYTIINSAGQSCYLRKNEGIISFSDEKGNTWTKK